VRQKGEIMSDGLDNVLDLTMLSQGFMVFKSQCCASLPFDRGGYATAKSFAKTMIRSAGFTPGIC
jgi:hypothetical protein